MTHIKFDSQTGLLKRISSIDKQIEIQFYGWLVEIDQNMYSPRSASLEFHALMSENCWESVYTAGKIRIIWTYEIPLKQSFIKVNLSVDRTDNKGFALGYIELLNIQAEKYFDKLFDYWTMQNCPFGIVARQNKSSLLVVTEIPFCQFTLMNPRLSISFNARLKIRGGEHYKSEPFYIELIPKRTEYFVARWLPKENGDWPDRGGLPNPKNRTLDLAEVKALQRLMRWRIPRYRKDYGMYCDGDWVNILQPEKLGRPNRAKNETEVEKIVSQHRSLINNMLQVGCNRLIIDHGLRNDDNALPTDDKIGWESHNNVKSILKYAREKGMQIGLYNGSGNPLPEYRYIYKSSAPFLPDQHEEWKVLDINQNPIKRSMVRDPDGESTPVNCLGCKEFREWFIRVQESTIHNLGLFWWGWDDITSGLPGRDTWQFGAIECFARNHDHLPGDACYVHWRAAMEVMANFRARIPGIWIQNYWGLKRGGPFSLRYVDTHENYYEYLPDPERKGHNWVDSELAWPSCNDMRLQYWYNYNERFLPPYLTYAPVTDHIEELIAAIAAGGAIIFYSFIPQDNIPIFKRWIRFAFQHVDLLQYTYLGLYGPPRRGGVDGWAHLDKKGGFLFLFNPNYEQKSIEIPLTSELGLSSDIGFWQIRERKPEIGARLRYNGSIKFPHGEAVYMDISPVSFLVLEILSAETIGECTTTKDVAATGEIQKAFLDRKELEDIIRKLPKPPPKPQYSVYHLPGSIAF